MHESSPKNSTTAITSNAATAIIDATTVNTCTIEQLDNSDVECPVCANGDEPTGAHSCYICRKFVHAIDACSEAVTEEGYGQKRVCKKCKNIPSANTIVACGEIENWRGLADDNKTTGKYLQKYTKDYLQEIKYKQIPIIKNGNNIAIKGVKVGKEKISLSNTCAFDSILHLFLAAFLDEDDVKEYVSTEDIFFKLVKEAATKGINTNSYRLRVQILKKYMEMQQLPNNCYLINCEVNVAYLCNKIFQETPSLREISKCTNNCIERRKALPLLQVKYELFMQKKFEQIEDEILIRGSRQCCKAECNGRETTEISEIAPFMMLELYGTEETEYFTRLQDIPLEIEFQFLPKNYKLLGIINFDAPIMNTRTSRTSNTGIGHYSAICYRKHNIWIKYDDMQKKEIIMKNNNIVTPTIVMYTV